MTNSQQTAAVNKRDLLFPSSSSDSNHKSVPRENTNSPWKIMVIDDDEVVHQVSRMVLSDFLFQGRPVEIIQGYSGIDCQKLIKEHPDTAVLLLDVVMESDTAGLDAVTYIRHELKNRFVRIILRTGQPGYAPEKEVIANFDINDYKEKTELTTQKFFTCVATALRAYSDIKMIEELAVNKTDLEQRVRSRTLEIMKINEELQGEVMERNKAYQKLKESEVRLCEAQKIAKIGSWEREIATDRLFCSDQIYKITGIDPSTPIETWNGMLELVLDEDKAVVVSAIEKSLKNKTPYDIEHRIVHGEGKPRVISQQGVAEYDDQGRAVRMAGTFQDITQRHQTDEQMRKLSRAVEQTADSVIITDRNGVIEYINPAFTSMTGYSKSDVIGNTPRILKSGKQGEAFYKRLWKIILGGEIFSDVIVNRKKNGENYYEEKTITPQRDHFGKVTHFISTGKDVTERIIAQERLHHLAHHDSLTGLPNRVLLIDRLTQAIARGVWRERNIAVMFMDIDRFKVINDTLGHDVGDVLLKIVSERLQSSVREGDTVARLGGDEFAIVLNDIACESDITPIADKIIVSMAQPLTISNQELFVTSSIGISLFPRDGNESSELLKKADVAMYRAKSLGKNNYQLYNHEDESNEVQRLSMETQLRRALDKDQFALYFQPQLSIQDGSVAGLEALLRWRTPEFPNASPAQFIPILEETGMINEVGEWVLRTACCQAKAWQDAGLPAQRVAVNLSISQIQRRELVKQIETTLAETGLEAQYLEIELTESLLINHINETAKLLHELHEIGVFLSIDDFGTGYSSMSYLKRLPFDTLKIDRLFIKDITFNPDDAAIATAIISLAHTMGMKVIAEGVETWEQLLYLQEQGCDQIQGYLYSPPLPAKAFMELILQNGGPQLIRSAKGHNDHD